MPTPSILSDEFSRAILSHVESGADNKAREEKKQRSKKDTTSWLFWQKHLYQQRY